MPSLPRLHGLAYGGDYNPEQWPESVWAEDARLMRQAGVNLVSVGIFSWAFLETAEGVYEFDWFDRVLDLMHAHDVRVDLATATASPPPWFSHAYPQSLPVDADGRRLTYGSRQAYCPSSPEYRAAAVRMAEQLATRYADHPALTLWHVNNEYGCHVARCWCDVSAEAFRGWLRRRYADDIGALNAAWGTAFWSQRYTDWAQVQPPRATPSLPNPTQHLDFRRFTSDELLDCFRAERDVLHRLSPGMPVTTNFMANTRFFDLDYWAWAREQDLISNDDYLINADPEAHIDLAFSADLTRSLAGGRPWLLMEHSTSNVNWQPRNLAKAPGQMRRNSLTHVARGSDGALFFQWRASIAGAEKFHSGMLPHAGTNTKIWREVEALGADLANLAEIAGSTVTGAGASGTDRPQVAILLDYESIWAAQQGAHPSVDVMEPDDHKAWHAALWRAGITTDFAHPTGDLSPYRLVLAPALYLIDDAGCAALRAYVEGGGTLAMGPFSGIVDADDRVRPGGYPGGLRDVLGLWVEEFHPLPAGGTIALDDGTAGRVWSELAHLDGASAQARYADEAPEGYPDAPLAGAPAVTRHSYGSGQAWYLTTRFDAAGLDSWLGRITSAAGVAPTVEVGVGVEAVRRRQADGTSYLFLVNHTGDDVELAGSGTELLTAKAVDGVVAVPARGVAVLREEASAG
ncbi:MAG TPA: beta-galactosidase [Micromonosporaceae bacterium]|nr:beta-galactosidase [Micromonosporaceae bacterium]